MSFYTKDIKIGAGASCDKRDCRAEINLDYYGPNETPDPHLNWQEQHALETKESLNAVQAFESNGWTFWVGSRTNYAYCPNHAPTPTAQSTTKINGQRISASCYHANHGEQCDRAMRVTKYRPARWCRCSCHEGD